jgi:glycosyltransferase involved in cell wall biosynthesis
VIKVSLILATNSRASLLKEMLYSVLVQSYSDWECLVIDDATDEETASVVKELEDLRIKYFKRPDNFSSGLSGSRNFGLTLANGEYYQFIDDDDILHPDFLTEKLKAINVSSVDYVISPLKNFTGSIPDIEKVNTSVKNLSVNWKTYLLGKTGIFSCSVLWHKRCFETFKFNEGLIVSEDYDLYWKLFRKFKNGRYFNSTLYYRRLHENTNSENLRRNASSHKRDFIQSRLSALKELIKLNEIDRDLGMYFLSIGIKNRDNQVLELINKTNFKFSFSDKLRILKYRLKYILNARFK